MQKVQKVLFAELDDKGEIIKQQELLSPIPVVRNHFNSRYFQKRHEVNDQPSVTIPDQAMTVQELMARFASGLPLTGQKVAMYDGEEELSDLDKMDLAEREIILKDARAEIAEINERVNKRQQEARERKLNELVEARLKEKADKKAQYEALKKEFENGEG